jgi:hypothetical protein
MKPGSESCVVAHCHSSSGFIHAEMEQGCFRYNHGELESDWEKEYEGDSERTLHARRHRVLLVNA